MEDGLNAQEILSRAGVGSGMKVADFGAGRAGLMVFAAAHVVGEEGLVYAVDVLKDALAMIDGRRKLFRQLNIQTVWGDFERDGGVRIPDHTLDFVLVVNNYWCVQQVTTMLGEAQRVLAPAGRLLLVDWKRKAQHPTAPPENKRIDAMEAEAQLLKAGWQKQKDIEVSTQHWGIVLTPPVSTAQLDD
jgi:ubiquinone/menaquinone biosynthesis C-methylase UbiE